MLDPSSTDVALLILRAGLGLVLGYHGLNKLYGPGGLEGAAAWFDGLGIRPGRLHAVVAAGAELAIGLCLVAGLLLPLTCAGAVALMYVAARTDHRGKGFFVFAGGWEYVGFLGLVAVAVAWSGPGGISVDAVAAIDSSGALPALIAAAGGLAAGVLFLRAFYRPVAAD